jgi:DNA-binding NarL/FixJ family response regulator
MHRPVLIADDHPLFVSALTMAARAVEPGIAVETAATLAAAEALAGASRHALILLDLMLPDVQGFAGLALLRAMQPDTPIAIVTAREEPAIARQALMLGARGFIGKGIALDQTVAAIRVLLGGGRWFPDAIALDKDSDADARLARFAELSVAQLKVLRRMADGLQNKQIAHELGIAEPTVKSHLVAVFRKLGVTNRTQAVLALRVADGVGDQTAAS